MASVVVVVMVVVSRVYTQGGRGVGYGGGDGGDGGRGCTPKGGGGAVGWR
jgi:hypothetical protein